jgi:hypothetical protein
LRIPHKALTGFDLLSVLCGAYSFAAVYSSLKAVEKASRIVKEKSLLSNKLSVLTEIVVFLQRADNRTVFFDERRFELAVFGEGYQASLAQSFGNGKRRAVIRFPPEPFRLHGNPSPRRSAV